MEAADRGLRRRAPVALSIVQFADNDGTSDDTWVVLPRRVIATQNDRFTAASYIENMSQLYGGANTGDGIAVGSQSLMPYRSGVRQAMTAGGTAR